MIAGPQTPDDIAAEIARLQTLQAKQMKAVEGLWAVFFQFELSLTHIAFQGHGGDLNHAQKAQEPVRNVTSKEAPAKTLALKTSKSTGVKQSQPSAPTKTRPTQPSGTSDASKAYSGDSDIPSPKVPKGLEEFLQQFTDNKEALGYLNTLMSIGKASDDGVKIKKEKEEICVEPILRPKGEAGDSKRGFNLAEAVGLGDNNAEKSDLYTSFLVSHMLGAKRKKILIDAHPPVDHQERCYQSWHWYQQDLPQSRSRGGQHGLPQGKLSFSPFIYFTIYSGQVALELPYFSKTRFPGYWPTCEALKSQIKNQRKYQKALANGRKNEKYHRIAHEPRAVYISDGEGNLTHENPSDEEDLVGLGGN